MWLTLARATALTYRSGASSSAERLDEILELLSIQDHAVLARRHADHVQGKLTWAKLASLAAEMLAPDVLRGRQLDAALLLGTRLEERDAVKGARVTSELREAILKVVSLAKGLRTAAKLRDGAEPTEARVYALLGLHTRWWALRRSHFPPVDVAPVLALVQSAAGAVLQSGAAHASLKGVATKALTTWTPDEAKEPPTKRSKLGDGPGESVAWDDDDDLL